MVRSDPGIQSETHQHLLRPSLVKVYFFTFADVRSYWLIPSEQDLRRFFSYNSLLVMILRPGSRNPFLDTNS